MSVLILVWYKMDFQEHDTTDIAYIGNQGPA